jgi:hypothetical protein
MAKFSSSPCKSPPAWQVFRFAVTPLRRGEVQQFAVKKSAKPPGFSLRREKVHQASGFFASPPRRFAVAKFSSLFR